MPDPKAYNDAASRMIFERFRQRLAPLMEEVAPDWLLHHMEIRRLHHFEQEGEKVEIRLVIKPLGFAREVPENDRASRMLAIPPGEKRECPKQNL
jgi:hypothetical protein